YIERKHEHEPARTISYIFMDDDGQYHRLTVFTPTIDKDDLKQAIVGWLVVLIGGLLLCMAFVNWHTLEHAMQPLQSLLHWLEHYRIGTTSGAMPHVETDVTEFRRLANTVADAIRRSEETFEQQKEFLSNASHEIQTPIAVVQNRLEMLLEDETLGEHAMGEVVKAMHALQALARTNRSLLLLCKIDNGQFTDTSTVDLGLLAENLFPEIAEAYDHLGVSVHVNTEGTAQLEMNESLARTLMTNLLKNAFLHNVEGGQIDMRVTHNRITLANTGKNVPLDVTKIFERFYHSPEKTSSTGLGLSIVKAVCAIYGISIEYRFAAGTHFFSLSLPGKIK
ncbi:MAG: sensor histidine kinase, partial [Prevotella sp.]